MHYAERTGDLMENRCVICGEIIPEGRQVCPACEAGEDRCCSTCRMYYRLTKFDYSRGGCKHSDAEGFACLAYGYEGVAIWMIGNNPDTEVCEVYSPRVVKKR